jgi:hypothetical protein
MIDPANVPPAGLMYLRPRSCISDCPSSRLPSKGNRNHVNVYGWPADKAAQKNIAQEVAAAADFVPTPETIDSDPAP